VPQQCQLNVHGRNTAFVAQGVVLSLLTYSAEKNTLTGCIRSALLEV
jgi:hypothetical protein